MYYLLGLNIGSKGLETIISMINRPDYKKALQVEFRGLKVVFSNWLIIDRYISDRNNYSTQYKGHITALLVLRD